jgi:hypothetical protein
MPRAITFHKIDPSGIAPHAYNDQLDIVAADAPGAGGAHHHYEIHLPADASASRAVVPIVFQHGPLSEDHARGLTNEALLAIVIDRLNSFQAGSYACQENAEALVHLHDAMESLHDRTRARVARGVEGTSRL